MPITSFYRGQILHLSNEVLFTRAQDGHTEIGEIGTDLHIQFHYLTRRPHPRSERGHQASDEGAYCTTHTECGEQDGSDRHAT